MANRPSSSCIICCCCLKTLVGSSILYDYYSVYLSKGTRTNLVSAESETSKFGWFYSFVIRSTSRSKSSISLVMWSTDVGYPYWSSACAAIFTWFYTWYVYYVITLCYYNNLYGCVSITTGSLLVWTVNLGDAYFNSCIWFWDMDILNIC